VGDELRDGYALSPHGPVARLMERVRGESRTSADRSGRSSIAGASEPRGGPMGFDRNYLPILVNSMKVSRST
jgi:hypothetical protein